MQVRIEIVSQEISTKSGKSRSTGNDYTIHRQEAFLHSGHHYPDRFEINPPEVDGKPVPYPPGFYTLAPGSIGVNREYGNLEINRYEMKLLRLEEPAKVKAA